MIKVTSGLFSYFSPAFFLNLFFLSSVLPVPAQILPSKKNYLKVISEKTGEWIYEFTFPKPELNNVDFDGHAYQILSAPFFETGSESLPKISYTLELPDSRVRTEIDSKQSELWNNVDIFVESETSTWQPTGVLRLTPVGKLRGVPLQRLDVFPFRYNRSARQLEVITKLRVKLYFDASLKTVTYENLSSGLDRFLESESINHAYATRNRLFKSKTTTLQKSLAQQSSQAITDSPYIKFIVNKDGIYKITYDNLKSKTKMNFKNIDPRNFRLFNQNVEVPIYVLGEADGVFSTGDALEFFGEKYQAKFNPYLKNISPTIGHHLDPWSDENTYILTWGSTRGLRLIEESAGITVTDRAQRNEPSNFLTTAHFEFDNKRNTLKDINLLQPSVVEDIWTYDEGISYLQGSSSGVSSREYTFFIESPETSFPSNTFTLRINFQGISDTKHLVSVLFNDADLTGTTLTWNGESKFQADLSVPYSLLQPGTNRLRILTPASTDRTLDELALNWFEAIYLKTYVPTGDYMAFKPGTDALPSLINHFILRKFSTSDISIYKKGISRLVNWNLKRNLTDSTWRVELQDFSQANSEYIAVTEDQKLVPKEIVLNENPSHLITGTHDARYLIITPKLFQSSLQRFIDYRKSRGLTVESVNVEDIYDEFNSGVKSPYAIRDFLRFTYSAPNWQGSQGSPLYVLLVGDASADPKHSPSDLIPVQEIQTQKFGPAASDYWFSLLDDNDLISDFFVGRWPVTTAAQIDAIVDKIIAYEQAPASGSWKNEIQFIGGQNETRGIGVNAEVPLDVFRYQTSKLINNALPQTYSPKRILAFPRHDRFYGSADSVINAFNNGRLIITYLGHGGGGVWGDLDSLGRPLLDANQTSLISATGNHWPFVLSMTCFVGAFDNGVPLGEFLLTAPNKGAIGVLASSGTGWILGDFQLLENSLQPFLQENTTVGEAIAKGKLGYLVANNATDLQVLGAGGGVITQSLVAPSNVFQFNLLGDPALQLRTSTQKSFSVSNYSPAKTETISITGNAGFSTGSGTIEVYQTKPTNDSVANGANLSSFLDLYTAPFTISSGTYNINVNLSSIQNLADGTAGIRIFGETADGKSSFNAQDAIAINATYISQIQTVPAVLTSSDTIRFKTIASDPQDVKLVTVRYTRSGSVTLSGVDTLFSIGSNLYQSKGIGPFAERDAILYQITVTDESGDSTVSSMISTSILAGIDLSLGNISSPSNPLTDRIFIGGSDETRIFAIIDNFGFKSLTDAKATFYENDPRAGGIFLGETTFNISGSVANANQISKDTVSILSVLSNGTHSIFVWVDKDTSFNDVQRTNNLAYASLKLTSFNVTPGLGTTLNGTRNDTVFIDNAFSANIPAGAVNQKSVLSLMKNTSITITNQPDVQFAIGKGNNAISGYQLQLARSQELQTNGKALSVIFYYDTSRYPESQYYSDSLHLYRYDSGNKRWKRLAGSRPIFPGAITADISSSNDVGLLTLMINRDKTSPNVEPIVEEQFFSQGSIVSKKPKIAAVVTDNNGVNLDRSSFSILVDNQPIDPAQLVVPDSLSNSNTATIALTLNSEFTAGDHSVTFQAKDVNGNTSDPVSLFFKVVSKFDIKVMGNFPNPFSNTTVFVFRTEASRPLEHISINIYTVAGKRIRHMTEDDVGGQVLNSIGYHEVAWDARDDDGHGIANGIYFYEIKGRLDGKTIQKKGKLAFFR